MGSDSSKPDDATPQVLDYQSPGKESDRYRKGTLPGTIGLLLLAACIPIGSVADVWGLWILLASLTCFCVQVVVSFYRVQIGSQKRLRVRPGPLALGLAPLGVFLAIILVLPMLGSPKERAQRVKCASNLRQIGQALALYLNDHKAYPPTLALLLTHPTHPDYDLNHQCFVCPNLKYRPSENASAQMIAGDLFQKGKCSYVYLGAMLPLNAPADAIVAYEKSVKHHKDGMNVLFADGHVEWFAQPEVQRMLAELAAGHNPPRWPATQPAAAPGSPPGTGGSQ